MEFNLQTAETLTGKHDLRLSAWGSYTKRYMGFSHIPDLQAGRRFDVSVFPGQYNRRAFVPCVKHESDYHPWKAAADLSYVLHRHQMVWKDQVYADVAYLRVSEAKVFVEARFVNNTDLPQNVSLHYMASIHFPPAKTYSDEPLEMVSVILPPGALWVDALDYADLAPRPEDHRDDLVWDGHLRGEAFRKRNGLVDGQGLELGPWKNDRVVYRPEGVSLTDTLMVMRYHTYGKTVDLQVDGVPLHLEATNDYAVVSLALPQADEVEIICISGSLVIDGFALVGAGDEDAVSFEPRSLNCVPEMIHQDNTLRLKYDDISAYYGIAWDSDAACVRQYKGDDLEVGYTHNAKNYQDDVLEGSGKGHYSNVCIRPLFLEPQSQRALYGMVTCGSDAEVAEAFAAWSSEKDGLPAQFAEGEGRVAGMPANPAGERYRFSQERMAATMLTNVVYPIRTRGRYIRHYTPGRMWDCLYTWDSGFVGLGLAELDMERSLDNLNAYVTRPGTKGAAFIHHGTPLPVQHYQFLELWNRTGNQELAAYFYPGLRQFHRFLAGHVASSNTRDLKSNLLRTWDYFYNSGGWDDYPAQRYIHGARLTKHVAPVANTAHAIRTAKILKMIAADLGEPTDEYDEDIATFAEALQAHAWDAESGYFSYVLHDDAGRPTGHLCHENGQNFNMGLDGIYPLVAGICTAEQEATLVERLMDPNRIWCDCGLSTVDQSAAYYSDAGYWNGSVWMPHQWFMWKALLSLGYGEAAYRIAETGLETWKREVEDTYNCFELFNVKTGRGGAWHHFGGLSSPVLCWFNAYHAPGRLTVGLDTQVVRREPNATGICADLRQSGESRHKPVVVAVVEPNATWSVSFGVVPCEFLERVPGTLEITLPSGCIDGRLQVFRNGGVSDSGNRHAQKR